MPATQASERLTSRTLRSGAGNEMGTKPKYCTKPVNTTTARTQANSFPVAGSDKFGDARRDAPNFGARKRKCGKILPTNNKALSGK
ncbi:MAG: hypothetical protein MUF71_14280 [Candidatus Kapabacteria bacterium]|nr:hypothetical protein [Candidatus Kapabacteria bacterium]